MSIENEILKTKVQMTQFCTPVYMVKRPQVSPISPLSQARKEYQALNCKGNPNDVNNQKLMMR